MKVYRQSSSLFAGRMIMGLLLSCVLIGIPLLIYWVWKYYAMSLTLNEKGLVLKTGILSTRVVEIKYNKINTVTVHQGFLANLQGYGDLIIFAGNDVSGIVVKEIDKPQLLKAEIDRMIEGNS